MERINPTSCQKPERRFIREQNQGKLRAAVLGNDKNFWCIWQSVRNRSVRGCVFSVTTLSKKS